MHTKSEKVSTCFGDVMWSSWPGRIQGPVQDWVVGDPVRWAGRGTSKCECRQSREGKVASKEEKYPLVRRCLQLLDISYLKYIYFEVVLFQLPKFSFRYISDFYCLYAECKRILQYGIYLCFSWFVAEANKQLCFRPWAFLNNCFQLRCTFTHEKGRKFRFWKWHMSGFFCQLKSSLVSPNPTFKHTHDAVLCHGKFILWDGTFLPQRLPATLSCTEVDSPLYPACWTDGFTQDWRVFLKDELAKCNNDLHKNREDFYCLYVVQATITVWDLSALLVICSQGGQATW